MTAYPKSLDRGKKADVAGTVSSNYKITSVVGSIVNSSGKAVQSVAVTPNSTSHSIASSKINKNLKFGSLAKGTYTLRFVAADASGKTALYEKSFTVK